MSWRHRGRGAWNNATIDRDLAHFAQFVGIGLLGPEASITANVDAEIVLANDANLGAFAEQRQATAAAIAWRVSVSSR
jgi:hypothetical protein